MCPAAAGLPRPVVEAVDPLVEDPLGALADGAAGVGGGGVPGAATHQAEPEGDGAPGRPHRARPEEGGGAADLGLLQPAHVHCICARFVACSFV